MARSVVVLGGFDGFHLGHRQLLHVASGLAGRREATLVAVVLDDLAVPVHLMHPDERCRAALAAGAHAAHVVQVSSADPDAARRVVDSVVGRLDPVAVVMACLPGGDTSPRYPSLREEMRRRGIVLIESDRWIDNDRTPVTSAGIAALLGEGDIARANSHLGKPYTLGGLIVRGSRLGHTIGFPTANVPPPTDRVLPARGVYAAIATLDDGSSHCAAVNIGVRPTVEDDGALLIEAHLLQFDRDIYDQGIRLAFRAWLRGEQRFESMDALVGQLALDTARTALVLG